jgi:hypothetical protein
MGLGEFARWVLILIRLRRALDSLGAAERRAAEEFIRRIRLRLRSSPDFWTNLYGLLPRV